MRMHFMVIVGLILLVIFVSPVIAATVWTPGNMADVGYEDRNINTFHWVWGLNYNQKASQTNEVNVPFQLNAAAEVESVTVGYFTSGPTAKITHLRVDSGDGNKYSADIIPALTGGVNYKTINFGSLIKMPQGMTASFTTTTDASGPGNFQFYAFAISGNNLMYTSDSPIITVMTPNGGETYYLGSTLPMSWTYTGSPGSTVNIEVSKGPTILKTLTGIPIGTGGSGSYSVTIPSYTPLGTDYKIRVTSGSCAALTDMSNGFFAISAPW